LKHLNIRTGATGTRSILARVR